MFSTVAALIASTVLAAAALGLWLLRTDDPVAGSAILAASRLALSMAAAIAAVTQVVHLTALSHDSIQYLTTASVLERLGSLDPVPSIELLKRQLAAPLLHTVGTVTGLGYVAFWTPLIGVATVGVTAWFANALLVAVNTPKRYRVALVVGGLAFLLTASQFLKSVFLVNGHMLVAGLVIAGIGMTWLGVTSNRTSAFAIVGVLLVPIVTMQQVGRAARWLLVGPAAGATLLWYGGVPRLVDDADLTLSGPVYGNVIGMAALVLLVVAIGIDWLRPLAAPGGRLGARLHSSQSYERHRNARWLAGGDSAKHRPRRCLGIILTRRHRAVRAWCAYRGSAPSAVVGVRDTDLCRDAHRTGVRPRGGLPIWPRRLRQPDVDPHCATRRRGDPGRRGQGHCSACHARSRGRQGQCNLRAPRMDPRRPVTSR